MTLPRRFAYSRWKYIAVAALLCVLAFEVVSSIRWQSTSWDEGDHLFAGYMSLKHGDFSLNPEHPPLAKMVAALPLLPLDLKVAPSQGRYFKLEAYYRGRELLYRNGPANGGRYSANTLLFRARLATSVFVLVLGVLVFFAGEEMFGAGAGLPALALFVFEPSIPDERRVCGDGYVRELLLFRDDLRAVSVYAAAFVVEGRGGRDCSGALSFGKAFLCAVASDVRGAAGRRGSGTLVRRARQ